MTANQPVQHAGILGTSAGKSLNGSITGVPPRRLARLGGGLYLINILFGAFAIGVVPTLLIGPSAAATAHNIQAHELLYRVGLVAHVIVTLTNLPMAVIFYDLFKVVNRGVALLDVFISLVATAVEVASLSGQFTPLLLLGHRHYTGAIPPAQLHALAYLPGDLANIDYSIYTVFYALDILCGAYLVYRSWFMPKVIGVLMAIDTLAYLVNAFTTMLAPGVAAHLVPWIGLPTIAGEGSFCLWLLIAGVDARRWTEQAEQASLATA